MADYINRFLKFVLKKYAIVTVQNQNVNQNILKRFYEIKIKAQKSF